MQSGPQPEDEELALSTPNFKDPGIIGAGHPSQGLFERQAAQALPPPTSKQTWRLEGEEISKIYIGGTVCFPHLCPLFGEEQGTTLPSPRQLMQRGSISLIEIEGACKWRGTSCPKLVFAQQKTCSSALWSYLSRKKRREGWVKRKSKTSSRSGAWWPGSRHLTRGPLERSAHQVREPGRGRWSWSRGSQGSQRDHAGAGSEVSWVHPRKDTRHVWLRPRKTLIFIRAGWRS